MPKKNQDRVAIHAPRFPAMRQEIAELPGPGAFDANYSLVRPTPLVSNFGRSGRKDSNTKLGANMVQRGRRQHPRFDGSVSPRPNMVGSQVKRYRDGKESVFGRPLFGIFQGLPRKVDNWPTARICRGFSCSPTNSPEHSPRRGPSSPPRSLSPTSPGRSPRKCQSAIQLGQQKKDEVEEQMERIQRSLKSGPLNLEQHRELVKLTSHPTLKDVQMEVAKRELKERKEESLPK